MFVSYEQVAATSSAKDKTSLTVPGNCGYAELQADTTHIRYTMDGTTPTPSTGMLLLTTEPPKWFSIEDLLRIRWISSGSDGALNIHYGSNSPN